MSALDQFSSLVATLYEAAEDPRQWSRFVAHFYLAMDSTRGVLCARAPEPGKTKVFLEGYTEREKRDYADYYFQHDEVLAAGLQSIEKSSQWVGPLEEIYSYKSLVASEIYNDYYRELGMHYASCAMVGATGPYSALGLAAWRSKEDGAFTEEQLRLVHLLTPHVKQAFFLQTRLELLSAEAHTFRTALDGASIAVIALRADGHILTVSPPAEALLSRREVLMRRGGRLKAVDASRNNTLQMLIERAIRTSGMDVLGDGGISAVGTGDTGVSGAGGTGPQAPGAMLLPQAASLLALQLQVLPVRSSGVASGLNPAVLIFVSNPGAVIPSRSQTLRELYQLTPLETRLAGLFLQGLELKQAADALEAHLRKYPLPPEADLPQNRNDQANGAAAPAAGDTGLVTRDQRPKLVCNATPTWESIAPQGPGRLVLTQKLYVGLHNSIHTRDVRPRADSCATAISCAGAETFTLL